MDVGNLISGFSAFSKSSLNIWKFTVNILLKPGLESFEHYFASVCDKCSCAVVWAFSKEYNQMVISTWRDVPHRQVISRMQFSLLFGCHVFSHVQLFVTPWTVACQAPLFMGFSGKNTGVGCHFLFQGIFPTQGSNPSLLCLLHWQMDSLPLHHLGSPYLAAPSLSWGTSDLQLQPVDSWLRHAGSSSLNGIKARPSAWGMGILSHWTTKEAPVFFTLTLSFSFFLI